MTAPYEGPEGAAAAAPSGEPEDAQGPVVRDKRVIDPETGEVRVRQSDAVPDTLPAAGPDALPAAGPADGPASTVPDAGQDTVPAAELVAAQALAEERLGNLQRVNAEYVNYRKRVDRDRALDYARGVSDVVDALIPVLDDLDAARQHGELTGPFAAIAEKLESLLAQRFGVQRYGAAGEHFDPTVHEALMHATSGAVEEPSVSQVLQPGYRVGDRVLRAARVAVVSPE